MNEQNYYSDKKTDLPTLHIFYSSVLAHLRKSSRIFLFSNYLLNLLLKIATKHIQTRYL